MKGINDGMINCEIWQNAREEIAFKQTKICIEKEKPVNMQPVIAQILFMGFKTCLKQEWVALLYNNERKY